MANPRTTAFYRKHLPHWEVEDGAYFITTRLHGSLPKEAESELRQLSEEAARAGDPDARQALQRKIFARLEKWLHASKDKLHLSDARVASMVMASIRNLETRGLWEVIEYVIMPNHVHLFVNIRQQSLWDNMVNFKRWTGREAVRILGWPHGPFWQEEWFDHWPRSEQEYHDIIQYIRANPVTAGLVKDYLEWPYGSWSDTK